MKIHHWSKLVGLQPVFWLDGKAVKAAACALQLICKTDKDGNQFGWYAPALSNPANPRSWRGYAMNAELLPSGLGTIVEVSVGDDGQRVAIPTNVVFGTDKKGRKTARAVGSADITLNGLPMVAHVTIAQKDGYFTVTPRITRPGELFSAKVVNDAEAIFG